MLGLPTRLPILVPSVQDDLDPGRRQRSVDSAGFVELALQLEGFDVEVCPEGQLALDRLLALRPELVLLDVAVTGVDGLELTRQIRAHPWLCSVPVIMLTARSLSADRVLGLTAGADDYVIKPFDTVELIARVRSTPRRSAGRCARCRR